MDVKAQREEENRIKARVVRHLAWDNRVDESRIHLEVRDGQVTLTGTVPTPSLDRAKALTVAGVREVENRLSVEAP